MIQIIDDNERFELPEGTSILILRRISVTVHAEITARNTSRLKLESGEWTERVNSTGILLDSVDYALLDWKNVQNPVTKEDAPCTPETKRRLPARIMEKIMNAVAEAEESAAEKAKETLTLIDRFLKARADFPGLNCEKCRAQAKENEEAPLCEPCPIYGLVDVTGEAAQVYDFISAPFFLAFPALVPDAISLLLPPMTKEQGVMTLLKLAMIHQFRLAAREHNNGR